MLCKVLAQFKQTFLTKCVSVRFISVSSAFVIWVSEMTGGFDAKRRTSELALVCFSMRHVCSQASFPVTWLRHSDTSLSAWIRVGRGVCLHSRDKGRRQRVSAGRGWGRREISSSLWERRGRFSPPLSNVRPITSCYLNSPLPLHTPNQLPDTLTLNLGFLIQDQVWPVSQVEISLWATRCWRDAPLVLFLCNWTKACLQRSEVYELNIDCYVFHMF